MKLIIDIPNYNLDDIQNGSIACGQILKAVRNGKPYEETTSGDLISRSALKEEVKKLNEMLPNLTDEKDKQSVRFAINVLQDLIDNAPTVETFTKDDVAGAYNEGYICGGRENKRPKGEWIVREGEPMEYECPFCGELNCCKGNFCPDCGADMRGDTNDD